MPTKISIIGNCQIMSLGPCLQVMIPDGVIESVWCQFLEKFSPADFIFLQIGQEHLLTKKDGEHPAEIHFWPNFYYPGFHPDIVYVQAGENLVHSPLGDYNSALVVYGWMKKLSIKETLALFCEAVFEHLSYFEYMAHGDEYMLQEGLKTSIDMAPLLAGWKKRGCFAHSVNHPKLFVICDIARALLKNAGIECVVPEPERFLTDPLAEVIWPVYPEIAARIGTEGDYWFKVPTSKCRPGRTVEIIGLEQFIERSFELYRNFPRDQLKVHRPFGPGSKYDNLESLTRKTKKRENPYSSLPAYCFWKKALDFTNPVDVDLVTNPKFRISREHKIATAGSCFAQHIAKTLISKNFNYLQVEPPPADMPADVVAQHGYGLFSARYGNIYTARQLLQLFERAYDEFHPVDEAWTREDGRLIDPFRPQISPDGYQSLAELSADRAEHLSCVRRVFEEADLFVFTVGLTEAWMNRQDGAIFPVAPGVASPVADMTPYQFINFRTSEIEADLAKFVERIRHVNQKVRIMLTVSPVPLVATYENRNVVVSTTYSKSAIRSAVDIVSSKYDFVDYFPSYEIITNWYNKGIYFEQDYRSVTPEGVAHVMRLFSSHYLLESAAGQGTALSNEAMMREISMNAKIICDEELLDPAR